MRDVGVAQIESGIEDADGNASTSESGKGLASIFVAAQSIGTHHRYGGSVRRSDE